MVFWWCWVIVWLYRCFRSWCWYCRLVNLHWFDNVHTVLLLFPCIILFLYRWQKPYTLDKYTDSVSTMSSERLIQVLNNKNIALVLSSDGFFLWFCTENNAPWYASSWRMRLGRVWTLFLLLTIGFLMLVHTRQSWRESVVYEGCFCYTRGLSDRKFCSI